MGLTFMEQIQKHIDAEFVFAVDPMFIDLEREWAKRYHVQVVSRDSILTWFFTQPPLQFIRWLKHRLKGNKVAVRKDILFWRSAHKNFIQAYQKADCVINLNGIAFVGDRTRSLSTSVDELTSSLYAHLLGKPFFRFIQSYGPFDDWVVRQIARFEFRGLTCVMARGELSAASCRKVAGNTPVYALPDVAITLPCADETWTKSFLEQIGFIPKAYIVLSPSAVIAAMPTQSGSSFGAGHAKVFTLIAKHYLASGESILFIPHMTSPIPSQCDREVCRQTLELLRKEGIDTSRCHLIEEELDCREMKALISKSKLAIVARYHALVAALSSGVPSVTVGWNDKYEDLLNFYQAADFAVDARAGDSHHVAGLVITKVECWSNERIETLIRLQPSLVDQVNHASKLCADWIKQCTYGKLKK